LDRTIKFIVAALAIGFLVWFWNRSEECGPNMSKCGGPAKGMRIPEGIVKRSPHSN
jgi:hypothetical protein